MSSHSKALLILLEHIKIGVLICRPEGTIVHKSLSAIRMLAPYVPDVLQRKHAADLLEPVVFNLALQEIVRTPKDAPEPFISFVGGETAFRFAIIPVWEDGLLTELLIKFEPYEENTLQNRLYQAWYESMEKTRAHLSGIRAAIETLLAYPGMDAPVAGQFQQIIYDQAVALSETVDQSQQVINEEMTNADVRERMHGQDWSRYLMNAIAGQPDLEVEWHIADAKDWFVADHVMMAHALRFFIRRVRNSIKAPAIQLDWRNSDGEWWLDFRWKGASVLRADRLEKWQEQVITDDEISAPVRLQEIFDGHGVFWTLQPSPDVQLRLHFPVQIEAAIV